MAIEILGRELEFHARPFYLNPPRNGNAACSPAGYSPSVKGMITSSMPFQWTVTHTPATATKATATKTGDSAAMRHVCTSVQVTIACDSTAQTPIVANLKDGSTVIASWAISAPANGMGGVSVGNLNYVGTLGNAMTLEFAGAGVAGSQQSVTVGGYSTQ